MYQFPSPAAEAAHPIDTLAPRVLPTRGQMLLIAMIGGAALLSLLLVATGLKIDLFNADVLPYYAACALAAGLRLGLMGSRRPLLRRVAVCAEYYVTFMLIGLIGAVASYPVAAESRGFYDPALQHVDELLHFDWLAWYTLVAAHPALQVAGRIAYASIYWTPALVLGYFAWTGKRRIAHNFLASFWIAAVLTLALFHFMPAVGPLAYLWHEPIAYMPESALWQPELIPALRHHAMHVIDLGQLRGLVSAPSFHTAAGVLYIAGAWAFRPIRWPVVIAASLMLLATPVEGTHYFTDMLAGAAVALTSLGLVAWIERLPARRSLLAAELAALLRRA